MPAAGETSPRDEARRPGRPVGTDVEAAARTALALFEERGYDAVSMADVAEAAGIGRRSLFRHARSKADLVWGGVGPAAAEMRRRLDDSDPGSPLLDAYRDAFVDAMESDAVDLDATRSRLRLIAAHAELRAAASAQLAETGQVLSAFVARRRPDLAGTPAAEAVTEAIGAASFAALRGWATADGEPGLRDAVGDALEALAGLGGPARAS